MSKNILTKVQEYAIKYLYEVIQMSPKTISKELRISQARIDQFLKISEKKNKKITTRNTNTDTVDTREKNTKSKRGVSVMTENMSQKGDDLYKKLVSVVSRTARNAIFRPRG